MGFAVRFACLPIVLGIVLTAACAGLERAPALGELRSMREAAREGERAFGTPADLVLAIAWTETRWQVPERDPTARPGHGPDVIGVGAIRPWLDGDPAAMAAAALGVDRARLERDPVAGVLAASFVLRELARRRGAVPAAEDLAAWREVVADYAGLDDDHARRAYVESVYAVPRRGLAAQAADGTRIVLAARPIAVPAEIGVAREYVGAEYPGADFVPASPSNYTAGRGGQPIRYVIIHTMQGSYAGSISWFRNPSAQVSAHYLVRSSDGAITQMVAEGDTAWHAGNWTYNQQSIGIEHEGYVSDPGRWYTDAMYASSARLVRYLCDKYGIPIDRSHIIGHVEVPGATHTDPGSGWDWDRFMRLVRGEPERPAYAATLVGQDHPAEMTSGERAVAWVEYRNDGSATWRVDRTRLGTTEPDDHPSPFYDTENWIDDHRATGADHSDYGPGAVGRFSFVIRAPDVAETTTITDRFRLVEEGIAWFGDPVTIAVTVHPRPPADADGDGFAADVDCDDASASVHPGASESCGDGLDQDCDGVDVSCASAGDGEAGSTGSADGGTRPSDEPRSASRDLGRRPHLEGCAVAAVGAGASEAWLAAVVFVAAAVGARRRRARGARSGAMPAASPH